MLRSSFRVFNQSAILYNRTSLNISNNKNLFYLVSCNYKTQGNQLKKGDLIDLNNKVLQVVKTSFCKSGARGNAYTQLELRDIETGKKKMDRVRTDQSIELMDTHYKEVSVASMNLNGKIKNGKPEGTVTFEFDDDDDDENTVDISASKLPWPAMYYAEGNINLDYYYLIL